MLGFTIPGLDGKKRLIGAWTQIICGLLMSVVELLHGLNDCIQGINAIQICLNSLPLLFMGVVAAASGLAHLGIADKQNSNGQ